MVLQPKTNDQREQYTYNFPVGCVLSIEHDTYHVCSDNAMIDSGDFSVISFWNPIKGVVETVKDYWGRGDTGLVYPNVDATSEVKEMAADYWRVVVWYRDCSECVAIRERVIDEANNQGYFSVGDRVKVVRGRKVPKGTIAEVCDVGDGRDFKKWSYIAPKNLELAELPKFVDLACPFTESVEVWAMLQAIAECPSKDKTRWLILCDILEEQSIPVGIHLRNYLAVN